MFLEVLYIVPFPGGGYDYKGWLKNAEDRLDALKKLRAALDEQSAAINQKIAKIEGELKALEEGIAAFGPLAKSPGVEIFGGWIDSSVFVNPDSSLTDAVRSILASALFTPHAPTAIRDELLRQGRTLEQDNPMAVIHQILSRLVARGEALEVPCQGKTYYKWNASLPPYGGTLQNLAGSPEKSSPLAVLRKRSGDVRAEEIPELTAPDVEYRKKKK